MFLRILLFLCPLIVFAAAGRAPIRYTLSFPDTQAHAVEVEATIPTAGHAELTLFMPVWTPGSYLVREYARHIVELTATTAEGVALPAAKSAKNRWTISTQGSAEIRVRYRLYARDISVRGNWVEGDFAVLNGAGTYLTVAHDYQRPYTVKLQLPAGWPVLHTPLPAATTADTFTAPDFDTLVDSPILAGKLQMDRFAVDGVDHYLVTLGGENAWDNARVARHLEQLVLAQRDFWGDLPYREPYYFFNLLTGGRGGLEHRQSTVITADRWLSRTSSGISSWLSLASHEYFHVWNGKRMRPVEHGPFEYEHEVYTKSLWIVEGITSYYQHVLLRRAGFYTRDQYLNIVGDLIASIERTPGRLVQALSNASYDAWIKAYRPDENSVNVLFSYYSGGALAALLLDAEIRRVSNGASSLDDVMRAGYHRFSGERGYTEEEFIALVGEVTGHDLSAWIRGVVQTPGRWDYQPMLDWYGLAFETPPAGQVTLPNGLEPPDPPRGWLGADTTVKNGQLVVTAVRTGTPAAVAGLYVDDEIIALNDYRVPPDRLATRLAAYAVGETVTLVVARRERLVSLPVTLVAPPKEPGRLRVRPDATALQKARLQAWIGFEPPPSASPETGS